MSDINEIISRVYTTTEIAQILGESIHKVQSSFVRRGFVRPSIQDSSGTGTRRLWNYSDVIQFFMVKLLKALEWTPKNIKLAMDHCKRENERARREGMSKDHSWLEGRLFICHQAHDFQILWADYEKFARTLGTTAPSIEQNAMLEVLDFQRSPSKTVILIDALHREVLDRIRMAI